MEWEYKVLTIETTGFMGGKVDVVQLETLMNSLGRDGRELAAAVDTIEGYGRTRNVVLLFKRTRA